MAEHSAEMQTAIAAMRAEWARIEPVVMGQPDPELLDDERIAAMTQRHELLVSFWTKHGAALAALGATAGKERLEALAKAKEKCLEANARTTAAEDAYLQASADVAEANQTLHESLLETLAGLEGLAEENWAAMEELQRAETYDVLRQFQERREEMLSELPAERRQYWEERLRGGE